MFSHEIHNVCNKILVRTFYVLPPVLYTRRYRRYSTRKYKLHRQRVRHCVPWNYDAHKDSTKNWRKFL